MAKFCGNLLLILAIFNTQCLANTGIVFQKINADIVNQNQKIHQAVEVKSAGACGALCIATFAKER